MQTIKPYEMITDYITGRSVPDVGAEANRQAMERLLVEEKGFSPSQIAVDVPVGFTVAGEPYDSAVDLVVFAEDRPFLVIKCAAGSLDSRKKEVIAAARIVFDTVVPYAAASDGQTALVFETASAKQIGQGLEALPDAARAGQMISRAEPVQLSEKQLEKARLVFRSYDSMNVNVGRRVSEAPEAKGAPHEAGGD